MVNHKTTIKDDHRVMEVADETFYRHQRYLEFIKKLLTNILKVIKKAQPRIKRLKRPDLAIFNLSNLPKRSVIKFLLKT